MSNASPFSADATTAEKDERYAELCVETFRGSNRDLQSFLESIWSDAYAGRMAFPVWSEEYLDWQFASQDGQPDRKLAIYEAGKLAGVLLGTPHRFRSSEKIFHGAHWSWLTIDPTFRGKGLACLLDRERVALEKRAGSDLIVSYRFTGSRYSLAEKPSSRFPLKQFARRVGFWVRALDMRRLRAWNVDSTEAFLSGLLAPFVREIKSGTGCRPAEHFDTNELTDCLQLLRQQTQNHALAIDWDTQSLRHQLCGGAGQTVVAELAGKVKGFINFHILPFQGRTREPIAIIDIMSLNQLPSRLQRSLLRTTLATMRQQGAILAMKLRSGDEPTSSLLLSGFIPRLPDSSLVLQWTEAVHHLDKRKSVHLLWR